MSEPILANTLVDHIALAIREEIVRQYREDERGRCPAGSAFYEKHIGPYQIARVAVAEVFARMSKSDSPACAMIAKSSLQIENTSL